jgi:hypothetical protein
MAGGEGEEGRMVSLVKGQCAVCSV